jgi:hypothetical protein
MPIDTLLSRIRAEYLEMPALQLTLEQAERLYGIDRTLCSGILDALVDTRFLCVKSNGTYARWTDLEIPRPSAAKAGFGRREPLVRES